MVKRTPTKAAKGKGVGLGGVSPATKAGATEKPGTDCQIEGDCSLSRRIGKVKPCGDLALYMKKVGERNALVRIVDRLERERQLAPAVWQAIESGLIRPPGMEVDENKTFFAKKVPRVSSLPTEWVANWLHLVGASGGLSKELLDKIDAQDEMNLLHIFAAATKTSLSTPLPRELQHKPTCARVFTKRAADVGNRLTTLKGCLRADFSVNWQKWGPFQLIWDEEGNRIKGIRHMQGAEVNPLPAHVVLTRDFELSLPWSDFEATLTLGSSVHKLSGLFRAGHGPNLEAPTRTGHLLQQVTKDIVDEMEAEAAKQSATVVDDEENFLESHEQKVTAARKATLDAARMKLQAGAIRRRTVALEAQTAAVPLADA